MRKKKNKRLNFDQNTLKNLKIAYFSWMNPFIHHFETIPLQNPRRTIYSSINYFLLFKFKKKKIYFTLRFPLCCTHYSNKAIIFLRLYSLRNKNSGKLNRQKPVKKREKKVPKGQQNLPKIYDLLNFFSLLVF